MKIQSVFSMLVIITMLYALGLSSSWFMEGVSAATPADTSKTVKKDVFEEVEACELKIESLTKETKELRDLGRVLHKKLVQAETSLQAEKELSKRLSELLANAGSGAKNDQPGPPPPDSEESSQQIIKDLKARIEELTSGSAGDQVPRKKKLDLDSDTVQQEDELLRRIEEMRKSLEREKRRSRELESAKNHTLELLSSAEAKGEWTKNEFNTEMKNLQEMLKSAERSLEDSRAQSEKLQEELTLAQDRLKSAEERANLLEEENNEIKTRANTLETQEKAHQSEERRLRILFLKYKNLAEDPALFDVALKKAEWFKNPKIAVGLDSALNRTYSIVGPKIQSTEESIQEFQQAIKRTSENWLSKVGHQEYSPMLSGMLVYGILLIPLFCSACLLVRIKRLFSMSRLIMWMALYNALFCLAMYLTSIWAQKEAMSALKERNPELVEFLMIVMGAYYALFLLISTIFFAKRFTCDARCALHPSDFVRLLVPIIIGVHYYDCVWQHVFLDDLMRIQTNGEAEDAAEDSDGDDMAAEKSTTASTPVYEFPYATWAQYSFAFIVVFLLIIFTERSRTGAGAGDAMDKGGRKYKPKGGDKHSDTSSLPDDFVPEETTAVLSGDKSTSLRNRRSGGANQDSSDSNVVIVIDGQNGHANGDDEEEIGNEDGDDGVEVEDGANDGDHQEHDQVEVAMDGTLDEEQGGIVGEDDQHQGEEAEEGEDGREHKKSKKERKKKKDSKMSKKSSRRRSHDEEIVEQEQEQENVDDDAIEFQTPEALRDDLLNSFGRGGGNDNEDADVEEALPRKSEKKSKKKSKSKHDQEKID